MKNVNDQIEMPKLVTIQIKKVGLVYKLVVNGVEFKRIHLTKPMAEVNVADICGYFGDDCKFVIKEAA